MLGEVLNMTVEDIFSAIAQHMIKGMMTHEQLSNMYMFLGLPGYACCHNYHFLAETMSYRKLCKYYINHHGKLIDEGKIENPGIIPESWYRYERKDVDISTKKNAVRSGLEKWHAWETATKKLYEQMYVELINQNEVASAEFVKGLVCDVDHELKKVEGYWLDKTATNFELPRIIAEQVKKHDKYKKKIACLTA